MSSVINITGIIGSVDINITKGNKRVYCINVGVNSFNNEGSDWYLVEFWGEAAIENIKKRLYVKGDLVSVYGFVNKVNVFKRKNGELSYKIVIKPLSVNLVRRKQVFKGAVDKEVDIAFRKKLEEYERLKGLEKYWKKSFINERVLFKVKEKELISEKAKSKRWKEKAKELEKELYELKIKYKQKVSEKDYDMSEEDYDMGEEDWAENMLKEREAEGFLWELNKHSLEFGEDCKGNKCNKKCKGLFNEGVEKELFYNKEIKEWLNKKHPKFCKVCEGGVCERFLEKEKISEEVFDEK